MSKIQNLIILTVLALLISNTAFAQKQSAEPIKGLDDQIQEIKSDVLNIAAELNMLEEKLLYPTHTQISVFVSLADGEEFRLDSLDLSLDNKEVTHHLYTFKELEALRKGGVQRLYTGQITTGKHPLVVTFRGKATGGGDIERTGTYVIQKDVEPGIVEIILAEQVISFRNK